MEILLSLSVCLLVGLLLSRLAKLLQLPAVTAYLVAGILVGPFVLGRLGIEGLGFISLDAVEEFSLLSDLALGFIAFAIGNEFRVSQLKEIGKQATVIGILQAVITTLLVDAVLIGLHFAMPKVLPLSVAIATRSGLIFAISSLWLVNFLISASSNFSQTSFILALSISQRATISRLFERAALI